MHKKRGANHIASDNAGVPGKELAVRDQRLHQISTAPKHGANKNIPAPAAKGQSTKAKLAIISIAALPAELG
ncbi:MULTISPECIES: hypothetical protein [unclassified Mesorhizobium]|uniref:hypothetical protein n=1 Tax=unclassified Mesorhizobium TaxID=325217 RepID=UPI0003CFBCF4|nr:MULTISPECIES: hypothetical protein [unclassified Mesorhizobium]ESZ03771.1 hypothetical protein X737_37310 [Mesorhizobium sp. L48C026A00]